MMRSAIDRSCIMEVESLVRPTISISPRIDDCGPSVGAPTEEGSCDATAESFSPTVCRHLYTSESQSNSTHTIEKPVDDEDLTRRTPVAPLSAVSIGNVTVFSTSSGAIPGASVITTTVGAFRSGKMSTSVRSMVMHPQISSRPAIMSVTALLESDIFNILLSISRSI